jgi:hypothetical protein
LAAFAIGRWFIRSGRETFATNLRLVIVPMGAVVLAGGIAMAFYNRAVTGAFTKTPYEVHLRQYWHQGPFIFSERYEPERVPPSRLVAFQRFVDPVPVASDELVWVVTTRFIIRLFASVGTAFGMLMNLQRPPYEGVFLSLALLMLVWLRSTTGLLITAALAVAGECLLWWFAPRLVVLVATVMIMVWIVAFGVSYRRNQWASFVTFGVGVLVVGQAIVLWWTPHYAAPLLPLLFAGMATTLQRLARRPARRRISPILGGVMLLLVVLHVTTLFVVSRGADRERWISGLPGRMDVKCRLEQKPGSHLVFVRYSDDYNVLDEWVYNPADLKAARVIFAHDLDDRNAELIAVYRDRLTWLVDVSRAEVRLQPYPHAEDGTSVR